MDCPGPRRSSSKHTRLELGLADRINCRRPRYGSKANPGDRSGLCVLAIASRTVRESKLFIDETIPAWTVWLTGEKPPLGLRCFGYSQVPQIIIPKDRISRPWGPNPLLCRIQWVRGLAAKLYNFPRETDCLFWKRSLESHGLDQLSVPRELTWNQRKRNRVRSRSPGSAYGEKTAEFYYG